MSTRPQNNILKPVEPPYSAETAEIFERYPLRDGYLLTLFRVFANSLRFLKKGTVNLLDRNSPLAMRLREIVILRVTANNRCEYEWGVHVTAFGDHVELGASEIGSTLRGDHLDSCWSAEESLLIQVVDELCAVGTLQDATLRRFQESFPAEEQLEVMALVGNYHTVSFVANVARLPPETFAARFDAV